MAECKLCKTSIPDSVEYCKKCFETNRAKMDESYLDNLLKSVTNTHNNSILNKNKVIPDMNSDFANTSFNKTISLSNDKELLNSIIIQNITKQDEKNLRDEYDKENELNNSTDDDILSLLQDYSEDEIQENKSELDSAESDYDNNGNSEMEDTDEDLLALLDMISAQDEANTNKKEVVLPVDYVENGPDPDYMDVQNGMEEEFSLENDILSLDESLDTLPSEISDSFGNQSAKVEKSENANDMSGIFSDVLSAVDTLTDKDELNPSNSEKDNSKEDKIVKKQSLLNKIFGKKDKVDDEKPDDEKPVQDMNGLDNNKKAETDKSKKVNKSEGQTKKSKKVKPVKSKSNKDAGSTEEDKKTVTDKKVKARTNSKNAAKKKTEKMKPAKVKKEQTAKTAGAIEDSDDNSKVNKLAIIFVMTFFILIGGFVILGTNLYSYALGIENANVNFSRQRYMEAYKEIYGLDIRKKDSMIYDKIMTVMFVNKELNSYNNYVDLKMYPEALDSLLKGMERYDKYIDRAKDLGIKKDMDFVKKQILTELNQKFSISEKEALALNDTKDQTKYSINVINTVLEKMK